MNTNSENQTNNMSDQTFSSFLSVSRSMFNGGRQEVSYNSHVSNRKTDGAIGSSVGTYVETESNQSSSLDKMLPIINNTQKIWNEERRSHALMASVTNQPEIETIVPTVGTSAGTVWNQTNPLTKTLPIITVIPKMNEEQRDLSHNAHVANQSENGAISHSVGLGTSIGTESNQTSSLAYFFPFFKITQEMLDEEHRILSYRARMNQPGNRAIRGQPRIPKSVVIESLMRKILFPTEESDDEEDELYSDDEILSDNEQDASSSGNENSSDY